MFKRREQTLNMNDLLIYGRKYLLDSNIDNKPLKIMLLLEHVLQMNKFELVINHTTEISEDKIKEFELGLEKLKNNIPIQYITNHQEFMKMNFYVDENVLIPQPDTEILVEAVIDFCKNLTLSNNVHNSNNNDNDDNTNDDDIHYKNTIQPKPIKILDLCTGSGAIAISLAKYIENCEITSTDISFKAIQIAKLNAENNLVHKKIKFIQSDMFNSIDITDFDIIVSNPPYIETSTISTLSFEVQKEPHLALDGGIDGLDFYRIIINEGIHYLNPNGKLFLEIGYNQKDKLFNLINNSSTFNTPSCIQDLNGNNRVITCIPKI